MNRRSISYLTLAASFVCATTAYAETRESNVAPSSAARPATEGERYPADNSAVNAGDHVRGRLNADDQGNAGLETTRSIRAALTSRDDFSVYAKNVKIITDANGTVTLRGPVRSSEERSEIRKVAEQIAGAGKVKDLLEIAPDK